jgi:putative ABC transport system permease protein
MLTLRYLRHNPAKALLLVAAFGLTVFLPLVMSGLVRAYQADLTARAAATPLVLGARGDRYDLVLKSLYFSGGLETGLSAADWDGLAEAELGRAQAIPLHLGYTAQGFPLVGTSLEYFGFRGVAPARGSLPLRLGDAVLGHEAAAALGLAPGDHLISDQASLFDIAATYPLKMRVTGVLAPAGTPDDRAVLVDTKTAWVIDGIGHGHTDLASSAAGDQVLRQDGSNVVGSAAVVEFTEITDANIASFHFHGDREDLPVSSIIVVPRTPKDSTQLKAKLSLDETRQALDPAEVVGELLGLVFKIKSFLDRAVWVVYVLAAVFTTLVVVLSLRLRAAERRTLHRIGCPRFTVAKLFASELLVLATAGAIAAACTAVALTRLFPNPIQTLTG